MRSFLIVALALISTHTTVAREIYVDNIRGDDRFNGERADTNTKWLGPVRSIDKALRLATSGDRVVLANTGTAYREMLSLVGERHSGSASRPFIIDGGGATLEGAAEVPSRAWEHYHSDVFRFRPERLGYQQLFVAGRPARKRPLATMDWKIPQLEPLEWVLSLGNIYFCTQPGRDPASYELSCADLQTGITLYQVHDVIVANLVIQGYQVDGVNAHTSALGVRLSSLTCRGNGRSGISVGGGSRVLVDRCLLGDNGRSQLRSESFGQARVADSDLLDNTAPPYELDGGRLWLDGAEVSRGAAF